MATEAHKLQVGIFVVAASVIAVALVIWLGASRFFERTEHFVSYFAESVQGLDQGSAVKYRGVPAGRVAAIRIAEDGELIEVEMEITVESSRAMKKDPSLRSMLELSGITGLRYVEIDRRSGAALEQSPPLTFKPRYEVILSARSSFKAIQVALTDAVDKFLQLDVAGLSKQLADALSATNTLLRDPRIDSVLTNTRDLSQSANRVARNLEEMTTGVDIKPTIEQASRATGEAKALMAELRGAGIGERLRETMEQVNRLAANSQQVVAGTQNALERLDRAVGSLQSFTEQVRAQPSQLLFSEPPPPRGEAAARGPR